MLIRRFSTVTMQRYCKCLTQTSAVDSGCCRCGFVLRGRDIVRLSRGRKTTRNLRCDVNEPSRSSDKSSVGFLVTENQRAHSQQASKKVN